MPARAFSFTSESVTEGHPDKIADQISDSVLDTILADDPNGRVACETLITTGLVVVAGEITTETYVDIRSVVRDRIAEIGMVVEGLTTAPVLRDLSHRLEIELPITEGVCAVLEGTSLTDLVGQLMSRAPTTE